MRSGYGGGQSADHALECGGYGNRAGTDCGEQPARTRGVGNRGEASPPASPFDDSQVTLFVMSTVMALASPLHVPVAVSCWCPPTATLRGDGVMAIERSVSLLTVSTVVPDTP